MEELESGSFSNKSFPRVWPETVRVMSWNINRGLEFNGIVNFLEACSADLILLQEADINAHRTGRRNIPREIAQALRMNYVFGREFQELSQGSPTNPAYHGQATLSRLPLSNARLLRFRDQSTFWRPRWFVPPLQLAQRRVGGRMALICELTFGVRTILLYNVHLESRGSDELRIRQLSEILDDMEQQPPEIPVLLAGDFNCDLSQERAISLMAGARIDNPFAWPGGSRTVIKATHGKSAAIDWMLTRGALTASRPAIHESITASDHFPLSFELRLR
jgi:endonuclease/exonuclease/phosphatase family metal-dependent hydrolase